MTSKQFIEKYKITVTNQYATTNPHMKDMEYANHYKTTIKKDGKSFTIYYSKGIELKDEPTADEVIECLSMDYNCILGGLDDFIDNLGYEREQGKKIFNLVERQTQKMFKLLGFDAFQDFKTLEQE